MSEEMVPISMIVYKNQHYTVHNSAHDHGIHAQHMYLTLGKVHDHGIHAQHLLTIYANGRCE